MNKTMATVVRAMPIWIAAILGYTASAGSVSNEASVTNASLKYVVRFQDLDLSRTAGAAALYARLRHAASVVCEPLESRQMAISEKHKACVDQAIADAVASVNRPLVSQYHQLRTKGDRAGLVQLAKMN